MLIAAALALVAIPSTSQAMDGPIGFTAFGGFYTGPLDDVYLGAGIRLGLGGVTATASGDYIFVDSGTTFSLNADATLPIVPLGVASIYGGGGVGFLTVDPDIGESDTQTVINLIAGAGLNALPMKPYGQLKYVFADGDDPLVFTVGVRF
jgi:hypothetical protein